MSDLDQILSDEPITDEPVETEETVEETPPTGETEQTQEEPQEPEKAEEEPEAAPEPQTVPLAALQETRQELRAVREQLNAVLSNQPKQEAEPAPDFFEDPGKALQHHLQPVEQAMNNQKLQLSRFFAEKEFGPEVVEQTIEYYNQHPELSQALMSHPSPFHAAVAEFRKAKIAQEIGSDPDAWAAKQRAEIEKKVRAEMVAQEVKNTPNAPSLASETNLGTNAAPEWSGPLTLDEILSG